MTEKQLKNLQQLLNVAEINCRCLTIEEVEDLQQTVKTELYVQQLKSFKEYMDNIFPNMPNNTPALQVKYDEAMQQFYDTDWHISFGNRSVVVHNEATVFNYILDMLVDTIDNCL